MRVALGVEYDGSAFKGWQRQDGVRTVQAELESALSRVANEPVRVTCAGRTDSGVHASHQVVHFDTRAVRSERSWVLGGNALSPDDLAIIWARPVPDDFHARFSALSRSYDYLIVNRQSRPGLWRGKVTWVCRPLNVQLMRDAARCWIGEHDFSSFRAKDCQSAHPVRTVYRFDVREDDGFVILSVTANAFLKHMIRNFAGVLIEIGIGRRPPRWAGEVLTYRQRARAGATAKPGGLYFTDVRYPDKFQLPTPCGIEPRLSCYTGPAFRS